jgi:integrase
VKLLERLATVGKRRRLSPLNVECYQRWVRRFLVYHKRGEDWRHPAELGGAEVEAYLNDLARKRRASASTQNQALNAIVFLYRRVLVDELGEGHLGRFAAERAKRPGRVPTVLSADEVRRVIAEMESGSMHRLMAELLYGTGMRVMECCTLRLRDLDFDREQIVIRKNKGGQNPFSIWRHPRRPSIITQRSATLDVCLTRGRFSPAIGSFTRAVWWRGASSGRGPSTSAQTTCRERPFSRAFMLSLPIGE